MAAPFPQKPKGMWRRTYARLREHALDAELRAEQRLVLWADRLRIGDPQRKRRFWR